VADAAGDGVAVLTQEPVDVTFAESSVFSVVVPLLRL
jgi:hypothetical protein